MYMLFFSICGVLSSSVISYSCFWFWLFGLLPENYTVQFDITQQKSVWRQIFFSFAFWFGRSRNTACLNFPEYVYFPDEYLLWLSWKTSDQTSCRVVRASALLRLEKPRSALERPWVNRSALVLHGKPRQIKYTQYDICRCVCICVEVIQDRNMRVLMTW